MENIENDDIKTEIVNLSATLNLPKGTEAFISDIHGNNDKYLNIIRSGAGNISRKVSELFNGRLTTLNQKRLVCLIYYPEEVLQENENIENKDDMQQWYMDTINSMVEVLKYVSNKYPREIVERALDCKYQGIAKELLFGDLQAEDKKAYYREMVKSLVNLKMSDDFIIVLCHAIQKLAIERIHILGDLYDRGSRPDLIIKHLNESWQNFDFEWGNHDVLWMGSLAGSKLCMLNLIRISARYHNLKLLKDAYDIDLTSMIKFATNRYVPLPNFEAKIGRNDLTDEQKNIDNCVQQAAAIMQFKLEGQAIKRRPEFKMDDQLLLDKLSLDKNSITINDKVYKIEHGCFQSVNPAKPYQITHSEQVVIIDLINQFTHSTKLNEHMWFMLDNGSMYLKHNGNLLFHGCVPVDEAGNLLKLKIDGQEYAGKDLFDYFEFILKDGMRHPTTGDCFNSDLIWYLWAGKISPLFGKDKMATFERYFINDSKLQEEHLNPFFKLCRKEQFADKMLKEFGLNGRGHIIVGHTPSSKVEPIMADKKVVLVNGMSEPKSDSKIGGYTLLFDSYGMRLETLRPFTSRKQSIAEMSDVVLDKQIIEHSSERKTIADTDYGRKIKEQIEKLSAQL
ncbi:fructose-1,6-bisphosphatase class 3 [Companilactobacillus crustorum]|uniref:Fructose-1,6-bisphosphatase class 3 n=3 Tax=Companilactobacillus TaxID=2767879 RepID=A0A837RJZ3_9LACO|nr:fructose-bisphosphatase class III [Companilactobacillus crustorum]KRK43367.1 fructose-1,6-bisphosphatase [Companilactobacillus crustorum JCM 15951]KRO20916.1 fructose-1,6-bisphosphatase [Companilactobacillus crustorum]GEO76526.1 fructose-1,6-bisphosphatase class 3 [Companilactobacillus crustorum]